MVGPFLVGGGNWSLLEEPALLLLAGGTGVFGWLPALEEANVGGDRYVHLVWIVKTEADYRSIASKLPRKRSGVQVTIYVTTGAEREVGEHGPISPKEEAGERRRPGSIDASGELSLMPCVAEKGVYHFLLSYACFAFMSCPVLHSSMLHASMLC